MLTWKMPSSEYAMSSWRKVSRHAAHDIRSATLKSDNGLPRRAMAGMPVTSQMCRSREALLPRSSLSLEKKSTDAGAISSCRVQPRENHSLFRNVHSQASLDPSAESAQGHETSRK